MNRLATGLAVVAVITTASPSGAPAAQARTIALSKAASQLGYTYGYLGPEDAVSLSRPGVTIVIRPGERLFDVNDRTESADGPAPRFANNDVYISEPMYRRLRAIAASFPSQNSSASNAASASTTDAAPVNGAISKLVVSQVPGRQLLSVNGAAPASVPVTLTLTATFSSEIANVVLSRQIVTADSNGTFGATMPVAPGYFRGAILTVAASSVPGVTPTSAHLVLKPVNHGVVVPADIDPKGIR